VFRTTPNLGFAVLDDDGRRRGSATLRLRIPMVMIPNQASVSLENEVSQSPSELSSSVPRLSHAKLSFHAHHSRRVPSDNLHLRQLLNQLPTTNLRHLPDFRCTISAS